MAEEPRIRYIGRNEDERIFSAQQFAVGMGILQRFGGQMTEDERNWMKIAFRMYITPETEPVGGVEPVQAPPAQAPTHPTQAPQQQHPRPKK